MPDVNLDALEGGFAELSALVDESVRVRESFELTLDKVKALREELTSLVNDVPVALDYTEKLSEGLISDLTPDADNIRDEVSIKFERLPELLEKIQGFNTEVVTRSGLDDIDKMLEKPSEMQNIIDSIGSELQGVFNETDDWLTRHFNLFREQGTEVKERALNFVQIVDGAKEEVVSLSESTGDQLRQSLDQCVGLSNELVTEGVNILSHRLDHEVRQHMDKIVGGVFEAMTQLTSVTEGMIGDTVNSIEDVNEKFEQVREIVEPLLPVLETIDTLS